MKRKKIQMSLWTSEEIEKILIHLDTMKLPFKKYSFVKDMESLNLLGMGGSAHVYEAESRSSQKKYAIKVIGFREQNIDSDIFIESVQVQKDASLVQSNIVKIYGHMELWVSFDESDNIISVVKHSSNEFLNKTIKIQFIIMEKIQSVIQKKGGVIKITPKKLGLGNEQEVLKLAFDIGIALKKIHNEKILHRDVKLENVFYSEKKQQYKLGDFGIAKKTNDGFARTIVFTKGYAAPEVKLSDERYDNTADIYSFGIMLYVLMNNMKFPDSNTYNVNSSLQYRVGYIVPYLEGNISEEFYCIIAKACMYDADQRYQSMDEMLIDIEKLIYGKIFGYKKEHNDISLIVGTILLALGIISWKLTFASSIFISLSFWEYVFLTACLGKGILKVLKKDISLISLIILGVGIWLLFLTGFTWLKLLILIWMTFSSGSSSGYFSSGVFLTVFTTMIQKGSSLELSVFDEHNWIVISLVSFACILLLQYYVLAIEDRKMTKMYYEKGFFWIFICASYISFIFPSQFIKSIALNWLGSVLGENIEKYLVSINFRNVGIFGLIFCIYWIIREKILMINKNNKR